MRMPNFQFDTIIGSTVIELFRNICTPLYKTHGNKHRQIDDRLDKQIAHWKSLGYQNGREPAQMRWIGGIKKERPV